MLRYMQEFRSEIQNKARSCRVDLLAEFQAIITQADQDNFKNDDYRGNSPVFRQLLGYISNPEPNNTHYPPICPIICNGGIEGIFGTKIIRKVNGVVLTT
jgi:hypothetical protein